MSWLLGGAYCFVLWLVFDKLRLIRLSLPLAIVLGSIGPGLILALLFCAQYFHPLTSDAMVLEPVIPIAAQVTQRGRVVEVVAEPNTPLAAGDVLFRIDPVPYQSSVEQLELSLAQAKQSEQFAEESVALSEAALDRAKSSLDYATKTRDRQQDLMNQGAGSQQNLDSSINAFNDANAALSQANAGLAQSRVSVETARARIDQTQSQLVQARYDLEQTTVVAPAEGFVTNLQLREGMMVGAVSGPVLSFVKAKDDQYQGIVVAMFSQKNFLRIKSGQYAEVALNTYPGQIFTGRVLNTIDVSGAGQLNASGTLPSQLSSGKPSKFAVRIKLDDSDELRLPGGSQALAAVYTDDVQIAGIPIMFVIRAKSWLRYLM